MPKALQHTLLSLRELALSAGPFLLLAIGLLALAYGLLQPNPPRKVVLATGMAQGAYAGFGKRYGDLLAGHGITVELRPSEGTAQNLAWLRDPASGVDLAFVQGGAETRAATDAPSDAGLVSLGSLFYEPVWRFYRDDAARRRLKGQPLPGRAINIGAPGSGVPALVQQLPEANRIAPQAISLQQQPTTPVVVDLLEGRLDAMVLASAPESLMVQMLLQTPGVRLFSFDQAEACSRRFPFMSLVLLPRGVVDFARGQPPADVRLVAPIATLVAPERLHPTLVQWFVQAAQQVHSAPGWFQRKGDTPNASTVALPLAAEADRVDRSGAPWPQGYLPFWLADLLADLMAELDQIDAHVGQVSAPLSPADALYALRSHIPLIRRRIGS